MAKLVILILSTILFPIVLEGHNLYWEELNDSLKKEIIAKTNANLVLKYYNGKLIPSDNDETFDLLDQLVASDDTILPLSFYLFNRILNISDGVLGEVMGQYCIDLISKHSEYALAYLSKCNSRKDIARLLEKYAGSIGYELYFKDSYKKEGAAYMCLKSRLLVISNKNDEYKDTFKLFWKIVDETIDVMAD